MRKIYKQNSLPAKICRSTVDHAFSGKLPDYKSKTNLVSLSGLVCVGGGGGGW